MNNLTLSVCLLVWIIPGFACFDKYLYAKGIEVRRTERKRD